MRRTLRKQQEQLNVGICFKRFCLLILIQAKTTIDAGEDQLGKSRSTTFWHRTCYASRPQWPHSLEMVSLLKVQQTPDLLCRSTIMTHSLVEMVSLLKVQHLLTPDLLCKSNTVTQSLEEMVQHLLTLTPQWPILGVVMQTRQWGSNILLTRRVLSMKTPYN